MNSDQLNSTINHYVYPVIAKISEENASNLYFWVRINKNFRANLIILTEKGQNLGFNEVASD